MNAKSLLALFTVTRFRLLCAVFCLTFFSSLLLGGQEAYAGNVCTSGSTSLTCPQLDPAIGAGVVTHAMVCLRQNVANTTTYFQCRLYNYMEPLIAAICTLVLIAYGIKLLTLNVQQILSESFVLIARIALVILLTKNLDLFYPYFFTIIDDLVGMFSGVIQPINGCPIPLGKTLTDMATGQPVQLIIGTLKQTLTTDNMYVWLQMDCIFGRIFNLPSAANNGSEGLAALFAMVLFLKTTGMMLFVAAISTALSFLFLTVRSILLVLLAYLGIGFLVIMSSLFVPCILFKQTTSYFQKWVGMMISFIIQPPFIMAFLAFTSVTIASLAYDGKYGGTQMWGGAGVNAVRPLNESICLPVHFKPQPYSYLKLVPDGKTIIDFMKKTKLIDEDPKPNESTVDFYIRKFGNNAKKLLAYGAGNVAPTLAGFFFDFSITVMVPDNVDEAHMKTMIITLITMTLLIVLTAKLLYIVPEMASVITATAGVALFKEGTRLAVAGLDLERATQGAVEAYTHTMKDELGKRKPLIRTTLSGGWKGATEGYSKAKGVTGSITGMLGGGMRGLGDGFVDATKSSIGTTWQGVVRRGLPDALKGFIGNIWTGGED